jgi:hypothetical protein
MFLVLANTLTSSEALALIANVVCCSHVTLPSRGCGEGVSHMSLEFSRWSIACFTGRKECVSDSAFFDVLLLNEIYLHTLRQHAVIVASRLVSR